jgi:hypothetical protein
MFLVILPDSDIRTRFKSDMSLNQHKMYNQMLNDMVQKPPEVNSQAANVSRMMIAC